MPTHLKCPACKTSTLQDLELDPGLWASTCSSCSGHWLPGRAYWSWLDNHNPATPSPTATPAPTEIHDTPKARLCPECGKILRRFPVGQNHSSIIDHCAGCEGFWLDANEWQSLRAAGLHTQLHLIVSPKWQAQIAEENRQLLHDQRLLAHLGPQDLAEIKRMKAWIDAHPKRSELYAYLLAGTEGNTTSYTPTDRPAHHPASATT